MDLGTTSRPITPEAFDEITPPPEGDEVLWTTTTGDTFPVRCANYSKKKQKAPSAEALYDVLSVDVIRSNKKRITHVAENVISLFYLIFRLIYHLLLNKMTSKQFKKVVFQDFL